MLTKLKHPGRGGTRLGASNANSQTQTSHRSLSRCRVAFEAFNAAALTALLPILARWLPNGTRIGREYVALNSTRADRHLGSFKILVSGRRAGMWADFATGDKGGDVISLVHRYIQRRLQDRRRTGKDDTAEAAT
jgi:hypothetical protein